MPVVFWRGSMIPYQASHVFSKQFPFPQCTKNMIRIRSDQESIEEFIKNMRAHLTFASRRKNRPDHGSCLRNTRARLVFPLTTLDSAEPRARLCAIAPELSCARTACQPPRFALWLSTRSSRIGLIPVRLNRRPGLDRIGSTPAR